MSTALELVYKYRQLAGKCETCGLSMDEIDVMNTIEALFRERARGDAPRQFAREAVDIVAQVRGRGHIDPVHIGNLGPGGLVCAQAPYFERGDTVEIVIDDLECALSYRFKAQVSWVRDDDDDFVVGVSFIGQPVLLRYGNTDSTDDVANAA